MTERDVDVSVVIPTYNERETIVDVVEDVLETTAWLAAEVLVIDDDSPDETWQLVREEFDREQRVRVIRRTDESGLSSAIFRGIREADGEAVVVMDGDGQHPPKRVNALARRIPLNRDPKIDDNAKADVTVGSRYTHGGEIEGEWPIHRRLISRGALVLSKLFVPATRKTTDPMSGFFAVDREVAMGILDEVDPHGFKALVELLGRLDDPDVVDVSITFRERDAGESTLTLDEQVRFLEHIGGLRLAHHGLDERLVSARAVRAVEGGAVGAIALALLWIGIAAAGADGWIGVGLIGAVGALVALLVQRLSRTGDTWATTEDPS